jgi:hypothetical protein
MRKLIEKWLILFVLFLGYHANSQVIKTEINYKNFENLDLEIGCLSSQMDTNILLINKEIDYPNGFVVFEVLMVKSSDSIEIIGFSLLEVALEDEGRRKALEDDEVDKELASKLIGGISHAFNNANISNCEQVAQKEEGLYRQVLMMKYYSDPK